MGPPLGDPTGQRQAGWQVAGNRAIEALKLARLSKYLFSRAPAQALEQSSAAVSSASPLRT